MVDLSDVVKSLLNYKGVNTDNNVFRLHYKFTVVMLLMFSFIVTSRQFFGEPIHCNSGTIEEHVMDNYCWIYSTFTVKKYLHGEIGKEYIHPGVGPSPPISTKEEIISHKYYQWVCIVLFIQAVLFYIPRYLWIMCESERIKLLVDDLGLPIISSTWTPTYKEYLVKYLLSNGYTHNMYLIRYSLCEALNFVNVLVQILLMDWFLSGQFTGFGIALAAFCFSENSQETNPMSVIFPKIAKCTYFNFGASGDIQTKDSLCVLSLNVVNEKIYIILWVWFIFLGIISLLAVIYRILIICSKTVRCYLFMAQVRFINKRTAIAIVETLTIGDWFILHQLGKNLNPTVFNELVNELELRVSGKKHSIKGLGNRI